MGATLHPISAALVTLWFRWHFVFSVVLGLGAGAHAAIYQMDFTGTVLAQSGPWDTSITSGTPLHLSATFFTPPPEAYDQGGYMTYAYQALPARMTLEAGDYLFDGARVDFTVWNNYPYFRYSDGTLPVDGYQVFTDTGTSPGFSQVMFSANLQTTATDTLATKDLPTQAVPLTVFGRLYDLELNANLSGSGTLVHLDGLITGYTLVEVPEPSALSLLIVGSALLLMAQATRHSSLITTPSASSAPPPSPSSPPQDTKTMKLISALSIVFLIAIAGCSTTPPERPALNSKAALLSQERLWTEAFKNRDKQTLAQILGDQFVFTDDAGQVYSKDQYISAVIGAIKVESYTVDDTTALVYGDTGIVTGRWTGKVSVDGKDASGAFRFTDVFVRRAGQWQVVASQDTRLPETQGNR